jgi:pyruvate-formate lyase-activating enzyme
MNNTYCSALFNHIYSDNSDNYSLCCYAKKKHLPKVNASDVLPFDWYFSDEMEQYRDQIIAGEKLDACSKCYEIEESGFKSPRLTRFKSDENVSFEPHDIEVKLRIFGNYCNLSCYTCHPYNSSTREKELKKIGFYERYAYDETEKAPGKQQYEKIAENILDNIDRVGKILFTGGEPLLLPRHHDFIERISDEQAKNIKVSYITNFTELNHKGVYFLDKIKRFKAANFLISCDHYGDKLSYIRYPIDVAQFERNLDKLAEEKIKTNNFIDGSIYITVSILNIEDIYDIKNYYQSKFGLKVKLASIVRTPFDFCITNHPYKNHLIQKYDHDKEFDTVKYYLKKDSDIQSWNNAIKYFEALDKNRGTDFRKLWPEYDYINTIDHKFIG